MDGERNPESSDAIPAGVRIPCRKSPSQRQLDHLIVGLNV